MDDKAHIYTGETFSINGVRHRWEPNETAAVGASRLGPYTEPETGCEIQLDMLAVDEARVPVDPLDEDGPRQRFVLWEVHRDGFEISPECLGLEPSQAY